MMVRERAQEREAAMNVGLSLLDEYLDLKERLGPLEKRLEEVRDQLRDLVTEHGHFVDEERGVIVRVRRSRRSRHSLVRRPFRAVFPSHSRRSMPSAKACAARR